MVEEGTINMYITCLKSLTEESICYEIDGQIDLLDYGRESNNWKLVE